MRVANAFAGTPGRLYLTIAAALSAGLMAMGCGGGGDAKSPASSGSSGGGSDSASEGSSDCSSFDGEAKKVWSSSTKSEILGKGGSGQAKQRQAVASKLDTLSEDWIKLRTATCQEHFEKKKTDAAGYKTRVQCFEDRLEEQRKLVTLAKGNDAAAAAKLAESMGTSEVCK